MKYQTAKKYVSSSRYETIVQDWKGAEEVSTHDELIDRIPQKVVRVRLPIRFKRSVFYVLVKSELRSTVSRDGCMLSLWCNPLKLMVYALCFGAILAGLSYFLRSDLLFVLIVFIVSTAVYLITMLVMLRNTSIRFLNALVKQESAV